MAKKPFTVLISVLFASLLAISCQTDSVEEHDSEALSSTSELTGLLASMSANDTTLDNIIDGTNCFSVKLPVAVLANGQQVAIDNPGGYAAVQAIFDQSTTDVDLVSLVFPVTVVYPDYEEVAVASQTEFNTLIGVCDADPDYIGTDCVSLNFPITIFWYNSGTQMEQNFTVGSNAELHEILKSLGPDEYYSISYPVTLNVSEGGPVVVNSNGELLDAITTALEECEGGGCTNPGILVDDLIIYMPFSGGVVQDLMGNAVTAPLDMAFTYDRDGNESCAVVFNGTQFLQMPANPDNALVQGDSFSVSLWFKMQNTNGSDLENLFTKGNVSGDGFEVSVHDLNTPLFMAGTENIWDNEWNQDESLPVDITNWHHLVVTVDEDNSIKLYRDGQLRNSISLSEADITNNILDYYIGNNFKGLMDDLRVYKKALSPQDVETLFELEGDCNTCL